MSAIDFDARYMACPVLDVVPSYREFLDAYLLPNKPVIIGPSLIQSWPALRTWLTSGGDIDWDFLKAQYGSSEVTVADCSTRDFSDQRREQMPLRDVISLWQAGQGQSLYIKDWHLARTLTAAAASPSSPDLTADLRQLYTTPDIFRDDWMNAYYSACTHDDFRFVYVGAAGTFTPLHRDVYTSYSWSTNVCGRKRWWLFPPDQMHLLLRRGGEEHLETVYDVRHVDATAFPLFDQARPIVVQQGPQETIFVPSGWYHQVENLTACISINHNWCNSANLPSLYDSMCAKVTEVEHALDDVKHLLSQAHRTTTTAPPSDTQASASSSSEWQSEWITIVQDVVEKDAGWNWLTFWRMVRHALSLALERSCTISERLWPQTPRELMPPLGFVKVRIRTCYEDFMEREQRERDHIPLLNSILDEVHALMDE